MNAATAQVVTLTSGGCFVSSGLFESVPSVLETFLPIFEAVPSVWTVTSFFDTIPSVFDAETQTHQIPAFREHGF
jgi:hypothetical protein